MFTVVRFVCLDKADETADRFAVEAIQFDELTAVNITVAGNALWQLGLHSNCHHLV